MTTFPIRVAITVNLFGFSCYLGLYVLFLKKHLKTINMKTSFYSRFMVLMLAAILLSFSGYAQSNTSTQEQNKEVRLRKLKEKKEKKEKEEKEKEEKNKEIAKQVLKGYDEAAKKQKEKEQGQSFINAVAEANKEKKEQEEKQKQAEKEKKDSSKKAFLDAYKKVLEREQLEKSNRKKFFNEGFEKYENKDNAKALTQTPLQDESLPEIIVNKRGEAFILTTKRVSDETYNEDIFVMPTKTDIYPGMLVYADTDLADGHPTPVGLDPGTVTLYLSFDNGGNSTRTGVINDADHVMQAIREMLRENSGQYTPPMDASLRSKTYSSSSKMAFDLNVSAKFLGGSAKVNMETTSSETTLIEVKDYTETYFTVTAKLETDKSKYFGEDVRWFQVEDKINKHGPIAMISSVSYGRRAYWFKEYKTKDFSFKGSESAGYAGSKASSDQEITERSESSDEWMYIKGGGAALAKEIFKGEKAIREAISEAVGEKIGLNNQGVILTYQTKFIASGRDCKTFSTASYNETYYQKCPKTIRVEVKNRALTAGPCIKLKVMYNVLQVTGNERSGYKYRIIRGRGDGEDGFADYKEFLLDNDTKKSASLPLSDIEKNYKADLDKCYIFGNIYYTVRSKTHDAAGVKWHEDENGWFALNDVVDGQIMVYLNGSSNAGKSVYVHSDTTPLPIGKK